MSQAEPDIDEVKFLPATRLAISATKGRPTVVLHRVSRGADWWELDDLARDAVGRRILLGGTGWKIIERDRIPALLAAFDAIGQRDRLVFMAGAGR